MKNEWNREKAILRGILAGPSYLHGSDRCIKRINRKIIWKKNQLIWWNPHFHFIYHKFHVTNILFEPRSSLFKVRYFCLYSRAFVAMYCRQFESTTFRGMFYTYLQPTHEATWNTKQTSYKRDHSFDDEDYPKHRSLHNPTFLLTWQSKLLISCRSYIHCQVIYIRIIFVITFLSKLLRTSSTKNIIYYTLFKV